MDLSEAMAELEAMGSEQNRKIYRRHGADDNQFGVSMANLKALKKRIKRDQPLAEALWQTGNQDARCLATMIADPKAMAGADLDRWIESVSYYVVVDLFVGNVVSHSPLAVDKAVEWSRSDDEFMGQAGWTTLAAIAMQDTLLPDTFFLPYLERVEAGIHSARNRTRYAMNSALIAIGLRNADLRRRALEVAAEVGTVAVDHGDTGCVTPDAVAYIHKAWARRGVSADAPG